MFCDGRRLSSVATMVPAPRVSRTPRSLVAGSLSSTQSMAETNLDLTGLKSPLPALKTRKALQRLAPGDRLVVTCTDPLAAIDIPNLIRETGDRIEEQNAAGERLVFRILKVPPR